MSSRSYMTKSYMSHVELFTSKFPLDQHFQVCSALNVQAHLYIQGSVNFVSYYFNVKICHFFQFEISSKKHVIVKHFHEKYLNGYERVKSRLVQSESSRIQLDAFPPSTYS